jgi:hypothetical protein
MDAKTAVEYLRRESKFLDKSLELKSFSMDGANLIADFIEKQEKSLLKINNIRNSIIGFQMISWSEHIYPLVAALNEAGIKGLHYPEAKKNNGTLKEKIKLLESQVTYQEKYAELGRLAIKAIDKFDGKNIKTQPCCDSNKGCNKKYCIDCEWLNFCQLRAELLKEI